jgi:outer membrane protein assembly factor BamA
MANPGYAVYPTLVLFSFFILPAALLGDASDFEGKTITRILFVPREQPVDPEELHRILPVKERTPLRLDNIRAAIARLYATGTYADIQVDAELRNGELVLRFITQNNWFIGRVAVRGQIKSPPNAQRLGCPGFLAGRLGEAGHHPVPCEEPAGRLPAADVHDASITTTSV